MAPRLQPESLLKLAHQQVARNLADICRILHDSAQDSCVSYVLNIVYNSLRPFWQRTIPACIRAQLLEETTSLLVAISSDTSTSLAGAAPLYLLVLLLAEDIKKLRIELCCYYGCSHQTALLKFLAIQGTGLESLELARSTLLRLDRSLLQSVLLSASSLRHLTFKNIANDSVLQIIGAHCPNLISLDVSHSKEVTDAGLKQLLLRAQTPSLSYKRHEANQHSRTIRKIKTNIHHIFKFLQRICGHISSHDTTIKDIIEALTSHGRLNNLCHTLKYLNIANTGVSNYGILLAVKCVDQLESVGEYCHIGKAIELLDQTTKFTSTRQKFQLKFINNSRTTQHYLNQIKKYFPYLQKFTVTEPLFPPKSLFTIPQTIISLNLQSIPSTSDWLESIQEYLNIRGNLLQELSLRFFPGDLPPSVFLNEYLSSSPNLKIINIDGASMEWNLNSSVPVMKHLQKVQLGKIVTQNVIKQILKQSPNLRVIHVYSCDNLHSNELVDFHSEEIRILAKNSKIHCLYIHESLCLDRKTKENLVNILPNVQRIGNVRNCGLPDDEIKSIEQWIKRNNFDIELSTGSHWFSSSCFPL